MKTKFLSDCDGREANLLLEIIYGIQYGSTMNTRPTGQLRFVVHRPGTDSARSQHITERVLVNFSCFSLLRERVFLAN